jgi:sn-glycerol 3-phosphate transport system substrate-binding protein
MFKKSAAEEQAAWKFLSWMVDPARQAYWSAHSGYIASVKSAWDLQDLKKVVQEHPEVLDTVKQLENAYYEPSAPNYTQIRDALHDATQDILANKISVRDGLTAVNSKGNAILATNP